MSQPAKRVAVSSVNWAKLAERLVPEHKKELDRLKMQNSSFHAEVVQREQDLPKVDWAELKKQMPEQSAALDTLKKQWESLNIAYGTIPENFQKEIDKWIQYNQARLQFTEQKIKDGLDRVKKVEEKWAKAPPVEHMYLNFHHITFFPHEFGYAEKHGYADWRIHHDDGEWRYFDLLFKEQNADEESYYRRRYHDYNVYPATGNPITGLGIPDGSGQPKEPKHWPVPLTELGRNYVKQLKERKRQEKLAGTAVPVRIDDH
uniref:ATP synthase subunit d, mitochondrial n=3 Tax=Meloidogyne TaxID=189290 RepID=A0A915NA88_9BILA